MYENDPLWKLRHALLGVGLATLLSVPLAAAIGSLAGDLVGGGYAWRAGLYAAVLLYVIVGAGVLFARVARHERRPVGVRRVGLWLASLWLWPLLLLGRRARSAGDAGVP
jgi:hypothetical protein